LDRVKVKPHMRAPDDEPVQQQIEALVTDEERRTLDDPNVPDDVKNEIRERLERFSASDLDQERPEGF